MMGIIYVNMSKMWRICVNVRFTVIQMDWKDTDMLLFGICIYNQQMEPNINLD